MYSEFGVLIRTKAETDRIITPNSPMSPTQMTQNTKMSNPFVHPDQSDTIILLFVDPVVLRALCNSVFTREIILEMRKQN